MAARRDLSPLVFPIALVGVGALLASLRPGLPRVSRPGPSDHASAGVGTSTIAQGIGAGSDPT